MTQNKNSILISITALTCGGKNYLLNHLLDTGLFNRVVSTTTRLPRAGEQEGIDYYFISKERSLILETDNRYIEFYEFSNARYGVTKDEILNKISSNKIPIIILEPNGVHSYQKICKELQINLFTVFIQTPFELCKERLNYRTSNNLEILATKFSSMPQNEYIKIHTEILKQHSDRLYLMIDHAITFRDAIKWDLIVNGTNAKQASQNIQNALGNL